MAEQIKSDYLITGAGAMGMAFADTLMSETDATMTIVDSHHRPGGHWNDAYPFVHLHQPSSFYGVNSKALGADTIDQVGWNKGLYELASAGEVCAYFEQVMQQQFLPSGRVRYLPMTEHVGGGEVRSLVSGESQRIEADKLVDATYMNVQVPSTTKPKYTIADGVQCVPLNDLVRVTAPRDYVIIGAGKTGMDAVLFLLANAVDPQRIRWIMPRDSWLLDRANIQPVNTQRTTGMTSPAAGFVKQQQAIAEAENIEDLFDRVEACGQLLRLDPNIRPTMYRCATVTTQELEQLRRIDQIIRKGHVTEISADTITLTGGTEPTSADTLHVDCSADALARRPVTKVFDGSQLTLQTVRTCQQVFSAAFIAHIEATRKDDDDDEKNRLCAVVPHPDSDIDFLRTSYAANLNQFNWAADAEIAAWLQNARLDGFRGLARLRDAADKDPGAAALMKQVETYAMPAMGKLQQFLAEVDG